MSTFALVHGAWHGGMVLGATDARTRSAVVIESSRWTCPSTTARRHSTTTPTSSVPSLTTFLATNLILVGHSMGGQTVPLVAARRHCCGTSCTRAEFLRLPGQPFAQQMADESDMLNPDYTRGLGEKDSDGRRGWIDKELAHFHVMNDCDEAHRVRRLRAPSSTVAGALQDPVLVACVSRCRNDLHRVRRRLDGEPRMVETNRTRLAQRRPDRTADSHSPFYSRRECLPRVASGDRRLIGHSRVVANACSGCENRHLVKQGEYLHLLRVNSSNRGRDVRFVHDTYRAPGIASAAWTFA